MKFILKFLLRIVFAPIAIPTLALTAIGEYMSAEPDWSYWRQQNKPLIDVLPWSKYR